MPRHVAAGRDMRRSGAGVVLLDIAGDHFGGFHVVIVFFDRGCGFCADGMMAKNPSAEMTSHATARKRDRATRIVSGDRPVILAKRAD